MRKGITRQPRRTKFHSIERVMSVVAATVIFGACASATHTHHPAFFTRLQKLRSLTVLPPNVAVYNRAPDSLSYFVSEKSDTARAILADAIAQGFPLAERFKLLDIDSHNNPAVAQDLESLRPQKFSREEAPPCLPTPVLALREAVVADAFLVTRALEINKTNDELRRHAGAMMTGLLVPPYSVFLTPPLLIGTLVSKRFRQEFLSAGLAAIQICLVDSQTGDELWSYVSEFTGRDSLQDPAMVRSAVGDAFKSFQTVSHELKEQ